MCLAKLLSHLPKNIEFYLYIQVPNITSKNVSWLHFSWPTLYNAIMDILMRICCVTDSASNPEQAGVFCTEDAEGNEGSRNRRPGSCSHHHFSQ